MADASLTTDLILQGRIARQPVTFVGTLQGGKLTQVSGLVTVDKSLEEFLQSLGSRFDAAREILHDLTPDSGIKFGSLAFGYHNVDPKFAQVAMTFSVSGNRCRFLCLKQFGEPGWYVAGLELRLDKKLFTNNWLSGLIGELSLGDLAIYYASADAKNIAYDPDQGFQTAEVISRPLLPKTRSFTSGINWAAQVSIGTTKLLDWPGTDEDKSKTPNPEQPMKPEAGRQAEIAKPKDSIFWIDLDKSLGPFSVRRIGLAYEAPNVGVKFDATLQLKVLTFTLDGLGISYPLNKFGDIVNDPKSIFKNLELSLDGMGLAFGNGPVEIGGSLLRVKKVPLEMEGTLLIRTAVFSLSAIGSYRDLDGTPSVMAYAVLLYAIGGDPAFFVTGLAFGFGVNRKLTLPPIEEVHNFPLIQAAMGKPGFANLVDLPKKLRDYVLPEKGNFWVAAGVKFTSYAMLESFALLSVSFGAEVEIGLLGLSRLTVPPLVKEPLQPVACAELALRAVIRFADGLFQVEARLTDNSYIFSKACRLTGGFAFCVWFAGRHAGDFVVSLGGYHPAFLPPAHYPVVPRVGIHWLVNTGRADTELRITGEAYFALTPSCLMAGGKLCAVFKMGGIEAWFIAYANFLLSWQPFFYLAEMGVSLGVACRISLGLFTISFRLELSVALQLWGPPFGGEALVSLWVISFTIRFGGSKSEPKALEAPEFIAKCLPADKVQDKSIPKVFSVRITGGLLREQEVNAQGGRRTDRIVSAHQFSLTTQSVIPCTKFEDVAAKATCIGPFDPETRTPRPLGIRPMGETDLHSTLSVKIEDENQQTVDASNLRVSAVTGNLPDAVWGKSPAKGKVPRPEKGEAKTIGVTVGIRISCTAPDPENPLPAMPIATLATKPLPPKAVKWAAAERISPYHDRTNETIFNTIWLEPVRKQRAEILDCLRANGFEMYEPNLAEFSKIGDAEADQLPFGGYFQQSPGLCALGTKPEKEGN